MNKFLLVCCSLALGAAASGHAESITEPIIGTVDPLAPFYWEYDVNYKNSWTEYRGTGVYSLARSDTAPNTYRSRFSLEGRILFLKIGLEELLLFSSTDGETLIPLERAKKELFNNELKSIPLKQSENGTTYHDLLSSLVYLRTQVLNYHSGSSNQDEWELLMTDGNWEKYYLGDDETVATSARAIDCYVIHRVSSNPESDTILWIAKEGGYMVKLQNTFRDEVTTWTINQLPI